MSSTLALAHLCRLEGERRTAVDEVNACYVYGKGSRMKSLEKLFGSFFPFLLMAAGVSCDDDIVMSFVAHARQWENQENLLKHIRVRHTMILRMEYPHSISYCMRYLFFLLLKSQRLCRMLKAAFNMMSRSLCLIQTQMSYM